MKKYFFSPLFVIFALLLSGCFEKPVEKVTTRHADGSKKTSFWVKSDGTIRKRNEWYSNGIKALEIPYKDSLEHGEYTQWSVHGDVIGKGKYYKGQLDGPQEEFFTDRRRRSIKFYAMGKREGFWEEFYYDGGKKSEVHFVDDKPTGIAKSWHKNGNLEIETSCFENKEKGHLKRYAENGKLAEEFDCFSGVKWGKHKTYYPGGNLQVLAHFSDGKLHGSKTTFYANGKIQKQEFYKHGVRDSLVVHFSQNADTIASAFFENGNGHAFDFCDSIKCADTTFVNNAITQVNRIDYSKNLRYEELWKNGQKESQRAYYITVPIPSPGACAKAHQKGKKKQVLRTDSLASESFYKNGKLHGLFRNWHSNGQLQDSLNFIEGERFGEQISFDKEGRITKHTRENGKTGQVIFLMD